jgi:hypothetical protein
MANLQYGDTIKFPICSSDIIECTSIDNVMPMKYDGTNENWIICEQNNATHMLIVLSTDEGDKYITIEIGKCDNLYLLADAIVD